VNSNSLRKTVTRQRRGCDLNPGPSAPESSTLTTRLPSHPEHTVNYSNTCRDARRSVSVRVAELSGENCRLMYVQLSGGSDDSSGPTMNSYMYSVAAYRQLCRRLSQTCNCSAVPMTPVPNDAAAGDINTVCSSKLASRSLSISLAVRRLA